MCRYMWTGLCDQVMCNLCYTEVDSTWVKGGILRNKFVAMLAGWAS